MHEIRAPLKLDRINRAILTELSRNGRVSHAELSARVGLSPTACARRQRALEEAGIIAGYRAVLGLETLGYDTTVIVRITLDSQAEDALDSFEKALVASPSVVRCFLMSGSDDYIIAVNARSIADFERIHRTELACLPHVARIQSSFALRTVIDRGVPPAALQFSAKGGR
jgi:Lrp/AsnC family leucine-responsive transcriptional regulator